METAKRKDIPIEDRRLWIGNLDPRVTELLAPCLEIFNLHILFLYRYQLLKLVQKHGNIEKFDLIFHRSGPHTGLPKGYAFVTYSKKDDAVTAKDALNNMLVGQKNIVATWAHSINNDETEKPKEEIIIPALAISKEGTKNTDRLSQIQAIEAKLKMMETKKEDELKINDSVATKRPVIAQYQYNKPQTIGNSSGPSNFRHKHVVRKRDRYTKPYARSKLSR